ncbi:MAG TPA: hypothetical protein VLB87_15150 [Pyrinomonadaceae bacterium]|nr:hypothetical protein [Pyrinomonadaceae bacterium]
MSFLYDTEEEIEAVVRGFETCTTPGDDFHHREHLVVAVCYLQTLSREQAVDRMRSGLLRFLEHHGEDTKKYSEEVTVFWIDAVASHLGGMESGTPLVEKCNQIISNFSSPTRKPVARVEGVE